MVKVLVSVLVEFGSVQFYMQINQEREGQQIDCVLVKNVLDIFVEISDYKEVNYYEDFERIMLTEISGYYSRLASEWLLHDSSAEYVQKVLVVKYFLFLFNCF